jgi:hypothetical protein
MRSTLQTDTAGEHLIYATATAISLLSEQKVPRTPYPRPPPRTSPDRGIAFEWDRVDTVERIGTLLVVPSIQFAFIEAASTVG